ncbi:hypothetical protein GCM10020256_13760 [Streptomyces thermocoprophilus]
MYTERPARLPGAVVWTNTPDGATAAPVLPDGCMDLLWHEDRLLVAGPDTRAYAPQGPAAPWSGVRFHPGTAPALLGVPAHELRDRRVELTDLWPAARARRLRARVAAARTPEAGLEEAALHLAAEAGPPDPLLLRLVHALDAGGPSAPPPTNSGSARAGCTAGRWQPSATARRPSPASCASSAPSPWPAPECRTPRPRPAPDTPTRPISPGTYGS